VTPECIHFDQNYWSDGNGYGRRVLGGRLLFAHRVAYEEIHGPIPSGMVVRHQCDTPWCVNPNHLITGTQQDNIRDRHERGRTAVGLQNGRAKMTPEMIEIAVADGRSARALARELGVSHTSIIWARNKKTFLSRQQSDT
jgi:hypothetical protein